MEERMKGIIPPLVTPLDRDGKVDEISLKRLINHCIAGGVSGIFVLGSCGEGAALTKCQKEIVVRKALEFADRRVRVLVGVLETSTDKALEEIRFYESMGAEFFVVTIPYYLGPEGQKGILEHYQYLAEHTSGKIIAYNIPCNVHYDILPETMEKLLKIPNLLAVKDSTGDWSLLQKALFMNKDGRIFCGNEDLCGAAMLFGADGCVPCLANVYPEFYHELYLYTQKRDLEKVVQYQQGIGELKEVFSLSKNWIAAVKYLCSRKGLIEPYTTRGIPSMSDEEKEVIEEYLKKYEGILTEYL